MNNTQNKKATSKDMHHLGKTNLSKLTLTVEIPNSRARSFARTSPTPETNFISLLSGFISANLIKIVYFCNHNNSFYNELD